jgi:hypothetical protein
MRHRLINPIQFEDWRLVGSDRTQVERQLATEFPDDESPAWGARIDAVCHMPI